MNFINIVMKENHLEIGNLTCPVPQRMTEQFIEKGYLNKEMLMGIRPEDFQLVTGGMHDLSLTAEVELSELMGAETLVYFTLDGEQVIAKIHRMDSFSQGQNINLD